MKALIAGGGTAGHVFPALALARRLADGHGAEVSFAGTESGLEAGLVRAAGFAFTAVEARPFVRRLSPSMLRAPITLVRSVRGCRSLVRAADVVVGMGGYVSGPVVAAGLRARRPVVLHEQNAVPGAANRVFARWARTIALSFAGARRRFPRSVRSRTVVTGNPVREQVLRVREDREALAKEAVGELELDPDRRTVVIFGGSQGALHLDRAAVGASTLLAGRGDLQFVLITGAAHHAEVERTMPGRTSLLVRTVAFLDRMELAYAVADLVVARAGATSIAEITACGLPSVLVPYPYATGRHQEVNAREVQRAGAATIVFDDRLSPEVLAERIESLVDHEERLRAMSEQAEAWGRPDAADALATAVVEALGERT
jgi:UDP-N-acetylglucosamine--N-acetylmuramyl-(pentapeptide) pyrophosphoryl-undecaprenol N-acetylglucosamine transferase